MPNYFGLLTKSEAKELRDLKASLAPAQYTLLEQIAVAVAGCQKFSPEININTFNQVVHDDVVKYFRNTMGYDVFDSDLGQPVGFTLLQTISWNV